MTICIIFLLLCMVDTESKDEREREAMQNHKYFIILCGFVHVLVILTIMD